jgi:uncharacterized protein YbjT (DUF2867 family)
VDVGEFGFEEQIKSISCKRQSDTERAIRQMYAITGITGQVGGVMAQALLAAKQPIRAIMRDRSKARVWADQGYEVRIATMEDATSLTTAFQGAQGVFVLAPPNFDPLLGFPRRGRSERRFNQRSTLRVRRKSFIFPLLERKPANLTC